MMEKLKELAVLPLELNDKILDAGFRIIAGYPAKDFKFEQGKTFFSDPTNVVVSCIVYFLSVMVGQAIMKKYNIKPFRLNALFTLHNGILTCLSLILLISVVRQGVSDVYKFGPLGSVCDARVWRQRTSLIFYINFLTKMQEWIDTLFLVLRRKKLTVLHVWHHAMTSLLCFIQLQGRTSAQWFVISLNLAVHVMMYYYYFLSSIGYKVWWRQYVTTSQIVQFIIDIAVIVIVNVRHFAYKYNRVFTIKSDCAGSDSGVVLGLVVIASYLVLFINFWIQQYSQKSGGKAEDGSVKRKTEKAVKSAEAVLEPPKSKELRSNNGPAPSKKANGKKRK